MLSISLLLIILTGCINGNPTPKELLKKDNVDIFMLDDIVFSNAQNISRVYKKDYVVGKEIGEIKKNSDQAYNFKNSTANKLPIGTKIYETNTHIYIAIVDDKEIPYLKMVEG
nr:hypothetical protein [Fredinandcohnia sp. SECRCQ15]